MTEYQVTGERAWGGYQPGETFEADLDPDVERRAIARGSIKRVKTKPKKEEEDDG